MMKKKIIAVGIISVALVCGVSAPALATPSAINDAQISGSSAFVRNSWVQSGLKQNGSFGSQDDVPAGFTSTTVDGPSNKLGLIADGNEDGTFENGDFFLPGSPYEAWGITVGNDGTPYKNSSRGTDIAGSWVSSETVGDASATWTATSDTEGIGITQVVSAPASGAHLIHVTVTLTNNSGSTKTVYYMRQVDPDNGVDPVCRATPADCASADDAYNTYNAIVSNSTTSQLVAGTSYVDYSTIGLRASDPDAVVRISDWSNPIDGTGIDAKLASYRTDFKAGFQDYTDNTIDIAFRKVINAGASATIDFDYILSPALAGIPSNAIDLSLDLDVGDAYGGASTDLSGGGLQPNSEYVLTEHSTPRVLLTGTTNSRGNFFRSGALPVSCTPGSHTLILRGTSPSGQPISDWVTYTLGSDCHVLGIDHYAKANGAPNPEAAELANTGIDTVASVTTVGGVALAMLAGISILVAVRRKHS